ncbi:hypothetical protein ACFOET_17040 [Parapedobacter deserti]|uniref:Uncharacterized protein n=1 Tax=Parapedobacter deserti TaxID=1912957 RepID=A0ABV7JRC3_9SPHI
MKRPAILYILCIVVLTFVLSFCQVISYAQSKTEVGIHFGVASNALLRFQEIAGGGSSEENYPRLGVYGWATG